MLDAFASLPLHPDVEPGLRTLADAGIPTLTLTLGSAQTVAEIFDAHGLSDLVTGHLSVDEIGRWKPAPAPYLAGCLALGLAPADVTMVAAHSWDLHGARRAGLRTAWVSRLEHIRPDIFAPADIDGPDLITVVDRLLETS